MKFEEFSFAPSLQRAITMIGFVSCTPVQAQSFAAYFEGKDIYAQSQTGTGKTAAFMLCGLQELIRRNHKQLGGQSPNMEADSNKNNAEKFAGNIKMLILSPTRELAEQIEQETKLLARFLPLEVAAFYGGVGYEKQRAYLDSGVQIITGTPGRVIDLAKSGELPLEHVQIMVLDEADRMLDMGFIDDVRWIMGKLPPASERLTMLYSATLNSRVGNLTWEFMRENQVTEIIIDPEQVTTKNVEQELYHVSNQEKFRLLLSLIKKHNPDSALIFCNTKNGVSFLESRLRANGYQVKALMGELPQAKRTQIVGQLKAGKLRFVVATDVASRGLHIEGLPLVCNYDLPDEAENYVHRIGRTARAGTSGQAISLACERYVYNLADIERYIEYKIPVGYFEELVEDQGHNTYQSSKQRPSRNSTRARHSERSSGNNSRHSEQRDSRSKGNRNENGEQRHLKNCDGGKKGPRNERPGDQTKELLKNKDIPKDKNERIKYYQKKYGEDFGAEGGREAAERGARRSENRSSNRRRVSDPGRSHNNKPNSRNTVQRPEQRPPVRHTPNIEAESKKSLWQRLFGKKKG